MDVELGVERTRSRIDVVIMESRESIVKMHGRAFRAGWACCFNDSFGLLRLRIIFFWVEPVSKGGDCHS